MALNFTETILGVFLWGTLARQWKQKSDAGVGCTVIGTILRFVLLARKVRDIN